MTKGFVIIPPGSGSAGLVSNVVCGKGALVLRPTEIIRTILLNKNGKVLFGGDGDIEVLLSDN